MKTHLDLFSGIGGFALAAQWNGLTTVGFSEIEPYACKILKRHWPDVPNFGDVRFMDGQPCDLLTGGFPCQPFSCAGKRAGKADDRHLWPHMLRVIAASRPTWVLGENVPGIIRMELDQVLSDLEGLGYATWPVVIPACAVDAPHRRKRVWIVGHATRQLPYRSRLSRNGSGQSPNDGENVADAKCQGLEEWQEQPPRQECASVERSGHVIPNSHGKPLGWPSEPRREHCEWEPEPGLGRVASGIPNRAHRLRGLGNSIVPQVAAQLIRFMIEAEQAT